MASRTTWGEELKIKTRDVPIVAERPDCRVAPAANLLSFFLA